MDAVIYRPTHKSPRLRDYDYAQDGAYFVTVCTHHRAHLFGAVVGDAMQVNVYGAAVQACWGAIPVHFPFMELDAFVVMPNHVHGIIVILRDTSVGRGMPRPYHPATISVWVARNRVR